MHERGRKQAKSCSDSQINPMKSGITATADQSQPRFWLSLWMNCRRNHSSLQRRRLESDAEARRRDCRCRRNHSPLASIRKSRPEIKNRCTQHGVNGENLASIRKFGLEIKNRCTQEGVNRQNHAVIPKSGPKIKNRCMQQAIFSMRSLDESLWRHVGGKSESRRR